MSNVKFYRSKHKISLIGFVVKSTVSANGLTFFDICPQAGTVLLPFASSCGHSETHYHLLHQAGKLHCLIYSCLYYAD